MLNIRMCIIITGRQTGNGIATQHSCGKQFKKLSSCPTKRIRWGTLHVAAHKNAVGKTRSVFFFFFQIPFAVGSNMRTKCIAPVDTVDNMIELHINTYSHTLTQHFCVRT